MKRTATLLLLTISLSLGINGNRENASTAEAKSTLRTHETFKVQVSIETDQLEKTLEGYMNGELRKLQGVEIDTSNLSWRIHIVIMKIAPNNTHLGYAFSIATTYIVNTEAVLRDDISVGLRDYFRRIERIENLELWTSGTELTEVMEVLKSVILQFDAENLEPERQYNGRMLEAWDK